MFLDRLCKKSSESTAHYIVTKIEKGLIEESRFHLEKLKQIEPQDDSKMILLLPL